MKNWYGFEMKILVTGGAGFLGSHLSRSLIDLGHEVLAVDNFYTGNKKNVIDLLDYDSFKLVEHDVIEPFSFDCDGIFNLACPASPIHYQRNPIYTTRTNFLGAYNSLDLAHKNSARILQASTSEIYGDPLRSPQSEKYWGNVNSIGIRACYDEGKRVAETLFYDYHRKYNLDIRVARIFNTYGPYMDKNDGRVVSNFIVQALQSSDMTVYGDGSQTRSFCYVDDLINGLIKLFFSEDIHEPINLGNPNPTSMLGLAKEIIMLADSSSKISFAPIPVDDPKRRDPDISKARNLLSWEPVIPREIGLEKTINYFKGILNMNHD
jgi:UDP-glucuronate decarboxylase